uniref:NADH-ubiquinone oxidoreductase chain 4 n=1 Tax=Mezira sp. TaxID=2931906 RepID=A0A8T9W1X0_9HEMI|nr:NADH dehydrogenase subunit 4 [Mezira sp.]
MMKLLLLLVFMIPMSLMGGWWLLIIALMMTLFCMLLIPFNSFVCFLSYNMGLDTLSYWMVLLTLWILMLMIVASFAIKLSRNFVAHFLLMVLMLGLLLALCFSSTNLLMFFIMFEGSIIPTLFLVFGWGYQVERLLAGMYFLFYTLFASLPMLVSIFWLKVEGFSLFIYLIDVDFNLFAYLGLLLAFFVKMPMVFVHYWLPKAHVEAPVSGSMILAGVLLKLGGYGIYRVMSFMYTYSVAFNIYFICLSLVGMVYVSVLCLFQVDMKAMVAYSSVSHMAMVISSILTLSCSGLYGSLIMMVGHGLCSSGLFCLVNLNYERTYTRSLYVNKGMITVMPVLSMFWFMFCANNMSSPFSLNLFGEFLMLVSLVSWSLLSIHFLFLTLFLSCCVNIYLYSITQHGSVGFNLYSFSSLTIRELMLLIMHWVPLNLLFMKVDLVYWI